eukprot:g49118.t1
MLCYAMLCYAMLRYATLCYATLRYAMLRYAMLSYATLDYSKAKMLQQNQVQISEALDMTANTSTKGVIQSINWQRAGDAILPTNHQYRILPGHKGGPANCVRYTRKGALAISGGTDGVIRVWSARVICYATLCYAMLCNANVVICYATLCYATLCYAMLCYAMLCYAMLCYAMLFYAVLCYAMLFDMLCYVMLFYVVLCYAMLCYAVLCYAMLIDMLCYAVLCYAMLIDMLCYVVLCYAMLCYAMLCNANVVICYATLCYAVLCYAMLCYAMLCYAMQFNANVVICYATDMLCYAMLCYAMLCYAMLCYAMLCYAMLCHAMPCHAMPCHVPWHGVLPYADEAIMSVHCSDDGKFLLAAGNDCCTRVFSMATSRCQYTLTGHTKRVFSAIFDKDTQHVLSGSHDRTVKIWDMATGKCVRTLSSGSICNGLALSPAGDVLASAHLDHSVRFWSVRTGELMHRQKDLHSQQVTSVDWASDGTRIVSNSKESVVKLLDVRRMEVMGAMAGSLDRPYRNGCNWGRAVHSPDPQSRLAAAGSSAGELFVWDTVTLKLLTTIATAYGPGVSAGRRRSSPAGGSAGLGAVSQKPDRPRSGSSGASPHVSSDPDAYAILSLDWNPNGKQLIAATQSGTLHTFT